MTLRPCAICDSAISVWGCGHRYRPLIRGVLGCELSHSCVSRFPSSPVTPNSARHVAVLPVGLAAGTITAPPGTKSTAVAGTSTRTSTGGFLASVTSSRSRLSRALNPPVTISERIV